MKSEMVKTTIDENLKKNGFHHKNGFVNGHIADGKVFMNGNSHDDCNKIRQQQIRDQVSQILNICCEINRHQHKSIKASLK